MHDAMMLSGPMAPLEQAVRAILECGAATDAWSQDGFSGNERLYHFTENGVEYSMNKVLCLNHPEHLVEGTAKDALPKETEAERRGRSS